MADIAVLGIGIDTRNGEKKAADLATGLKNISSAADSVGKSSGTMTGSFIKAQLALDSLKKVTSFVVGQFSSAIEAGKRFEESMSQVKAVSGATSAQFADLTAAAKAMGEQTKFSASEAADGLVLLSQAGLKAEQSIAALPDVLNLAAAGGLSMGQAADIATNAMSGMRLQVSDLTRITDVFAKTASSSNTNVGAMGESFKYVASIGASAGVSVERLSAMIGILGNAGIQGSMAGTQLAFGISKMAKEGKDFFEVLKELERTGADTAKVMDMFGERAGRAVLAILGQGVGTLEQFEAQLMNSSGAAEEMARIMNDNLGGDLKQLNSIIEAVRLEMFDSFGPDLRTAVQAITQAIRDNKDSAIELFRDGWTVLQGAGTSLKIIFDSVSGGLFGMTEEIAKGKSATDLFRDSGLFLIDVFSTINLTILDVTTAFQKFASVFSGPGEVIFKNLKAVFSGDFGGIEFKNPITLLNEIADNFSKIDRESAKSRKEINALFDEMRDKSISATDELIKKNAERADSEKSVTNSVAANVEMTKSAAAAVQELTQKTEESTDSIDLLEAITANLTNEKKNLEIVTISNDKAFIKERDSVSGLASAYGFAAEKAEQFAKGSIAARFAQTSMDKTGSITGLSLYGQTFSVQNPVSAPASSSFSSSSFSAPQTSSGNSLSNLLSRYERLSASVTDYMSRDTAVDIKLQDAKAELREISLELASISENDLEKRLELSERYFETSKNIETLQKSIAREQQTALSAQRTSAEGLNSILGSVLSDMDELIAGDFSNALPVEQLAALEAQFTATKNAIDSIDWTDITTADQQLISQFQNVGKEFLKQSQEVFKSSGNYDVIKDSVTAEFDDLAAKLVTAMAKADPTVFNENMDKLGTNFSTLYSKSDSARTGVIKLTNSLSANTGTTLSGSSVGASTNINTLADAILNNLGFNADETKTKTNAFSETLKTLGEKTEESGKEAKTTSLKTTDLSNTLTGTALPLSNASNNLSTIATNTESVFAKIVADSASMKTALEQQKATLDTKQAQIDSINVFSGYQSSGNMLQGLSQTGAILQAAQGASSSDISVRSGGQEAYIRKIAGQIERRVDSLTNQTGEKTVLTDGTVISDTISGRTWSNMTTKTNLPYYTYDYFGSGQQLGTGLTSRPFATGAWSINRPTQNAILHNGEMVIRSEDANFVRASLSSAGRADSYGQPNGMTNSGNDKQIIYVLSAILDELRENRNPVVVMNSRRVSEELDRFKALSS